jgi:hypothetical protein
VHLGTAAVVGLEGALALAHGRSPGFSLPQQVSVSWLPRGCLRSARQRHSPQTGDTSRVRTISRPHQIGGSRRGRSALRRAARDTCPGRALVARRHAC